MKKVLSANLTSYDFLKFIALALMIADHVGYYFYPDDMWIRAVGRLSAPIWLFLVGYAKSRDFSARMWVGIVVLVVTNYMVGSGVLPLSILATILLFRALIDPVMETVKRRRAALYPICAVLFLATFVDYLVIEYGTEVMMIVMLGYMTRNRDSLPFTRSQYIEFAVLAIASHAFFQEMFFFPFNLYQKLFVTAGLIGVISMLTRFKPAEYPVLTASLPGPLVWLFQICGRRTLEIYVIHQVLFRFMALYMGQEGYSWFTFRIFG